MLNRGGVIRVPRISRPLQRTNFLVRCPCAFRLRRLAQTRCRGDLSSEGIVLLARRAIFFGLWLFFVAGLVLAGHVEVWNVVLRDRCSHGIFCTVAKRGRSPWKIDDGWPESAEENVTLVLL